MRVVIQRVKKAEVFVENNRVAAIKGGILAFLGIASGDDGSQIPWLTKKICELRIFPDNQDKMNFSVKDVGKSILLVSQFTLYANLNRGRRPDFFQAADPNKAEKLFNSFKQELDKSGLQIQTGVFGASMQVSLINDGPVTLILERTNI